VGPGGVCQSNDFWHLSRRISETEQDIPQLVLMANMKLNTAFRLVLQPMTLDDLEWSLRTI